MQQANVNKAQAVSIHTPTKGVTHDKFYNSKSSTVSIHTPTKGVTLQQANVNKAQAVSIHTPTKGVTQPYHSTIADNVFQSTHPRRV